MNTKLQNPTHIAIIMDGNRRWAYEKNLPDTKGHSEALNRIKEVIEYCAQKHIAYVTLWVWSTKNWKRNPTFINNILALFRECLKPNGIFTDAIKKGAELTYLGSLEDFPKDIQEKVLIFLSQKPKQTLVHVNFAVGYDGQDEIVRALKKMIDDGISSDAVTKERIDSYLDTKGQPPVDLVIRTGGEKRTSGFLIWQAAQAELYFTNTYMPDFGKEELQKALDDYAKRERRFGGDSKKNSNS